MRIEPCLRQSLCAAFFIRLLALDEFAKTKDAAKKQILIVRQLREWLSDFVDALLPSLRQNEAALTALTLSMRLWKAAADHLPDTDSLPWELLKKTVQELLRADVDERVRTEFLEKFMGPYDDVRFYTFRAIQCVTLCPPPPPSPSQRDQALILAQIYPSRQGDRPQRNFCEQCI